MTGAASEQERTPRVRMTGTQRREQLIEVGRTLFAERGYEAASVEEIAGRANVSKPVVYEHFGGKEGLYAVIVDREMSTLLGMITSSLELNRSRIRVERVALALLTYIEERTDGFRILVRDSPASAEDGKYSSLLNEAVGRVGHMLAGGFLPARSGSGIRADVCAGVGRHGVDDGPVVARRANAAQGSGCGPRGEPVLERADESGGGPSTDRGMTTLFRLSPRKKGGIVPFVGREGRNTSGAIAIRTDAC